MTFRNFELDGDALIEPLFRKDPTRCARLVSALEQFIEYGQSRGDVAAGAVGRVAIFLTPARFLLRGMPDAAALVKVDYESRLVEIIEVIDDYLDEEDWERVRAFCADAID
jgi:hypothetical protein